VKGIQALPSLRFAPGTLERERERRERERERERREREREELY
jgi:hypothetical protein